MIALRLRAAWHELRCWECRVTWVSWAQRLAGMKRGQTPRMSQRHRHPVEQIRRAEVALADHKAALLDALGMDPLRDWDDIVNAARGIRKQRDVMDPPAPADAVAVLGEILDAFHLAYTDPDREFIGAVIRGAVAPDDYRRWRRVHRAAEVSRAPDADPADEETDHG